MNLVSPIEIIVTKPHKKSWLIDQPAFTFLARPIIYNKGNFWTLFSSSFLPGHQLKK